MSQTPDNVCLHLLVQGNQGSFRTPLFFCFFGPFLRRTVSNSLSFLPGLSSSAIVAGQQTSSPSMYPPARRWERWVSHTWTSEHLLPLACWVFTRYKSWGWSSLYSNKFWKIDFVLNKVNNLNTAEVNQEVDRKTL